MDIIVCTKNNKYTEQKSNQARLQFMINEIRQRGIVELRTIGDKGNAKQIFIKRFSNEIECNKTYQRRNLQLYKKTNN